MCADDAALFSSNPEELQAAFDSVNNGHWKIA
jgi:hypothetical protein